MKVHAAVVVGDEFAERTRCGVAAARVNVALEPGSVTCARCRRSLPPPGPGNESGVVDAWTSRWGVRYERLACGHSRRAPAQPTASPAGSDAKPRPPGYCPAAGCHEAAP